MNVASVLFMESYQMIVDELYNVYTYNWIPRIVIDTLCCRLGHSNQMDKKKYLCNFELDLRRMSIYVMSSNTTSVRLNYILC